MDWPNLNKKDNPHKWTKIVRRELHEYDIFIIENEQEVVLTTFRSIQVGNGGVHLDGGNEEQIIYYDENARALKLFGPQALITALREGNTEVGKSVE